MADSIPEQSAFRPILARATLIGFSLGVVVVAAGSLLLGGGLAMMRDAAGLVATAVVAVAVGLWAGAPGAELEELPTRARWAAAGLTAAAAGAFSTAWRLYPALAGSPAARTFGLLLLVALPAYALGSALPVVLGAAERWEEVLDGGGAGWGALGLMVTGTLGGVAVGVLAGGLLLVPALTAGPVLLSVSILLLAPLVIPEPEDPLLEERVLHEETTPFSRLRVTEMVYSGERQPERRLFLNGEEESAEQVRSGAPALAYIAAAETWLLGTTPAASTFLFLGGGAYTLPRRVAERDPRARITVVELDPEVTQVAQHFFGLRREHRIVSVHGDARAYLERAGEPARFDRIYVDVYAGGESLPYSMVTRESFQAMARLLRPGGLVAMNVIGVVGGEEGVRFWSVVRTFEGVFPSVALYSHLGRDYPDRQNLLLAGAPVAGHSLPARAGLFDRWPRGEWPDERGTTVFRDLYPSGTAATADGAASAPSAGASASAEWRPSAGPDGASSGPSVSASRPPSHDTAGHSEPGS